ncbi:hypothetical protein GCM10010249_56100 [Streptomyces roseolilacinus]|uniref:Uncharacterized protein n=1 Tax=Streptomyces roseolilacinus TaxID=66904 RepID=A0A918B7I7_9ACTN|nr:hypothetical protein GCM10010249_56100 [Streptomyces roseolilacinus]
MVRRGLAMLRIVIVVFTVAQTSLLGSGGRRGALDGWPIPVKRQAKHPVPRQYREQPATGM